ncbi:MAG: symmetrical bis(5'-nucleosyl)-tetraphosphatase [Proteobacteria bacterium]|nr:symmetrical bis(5'-nucleosyl)-tetraphosphatase [Pseudomonadota bacterium]MBS0465136.1 symmetrical bis(5'-nucleosyl)-tetraphosphatase [Pseudomonadota bacterium]
MTTWAIGDLQGCYDPLQRLLEKIAFDPARDRLWFCGDLVNRGGQSLHTLRLVHSLSIHSTVVLGNHDLALLSIAQRREVEQRKVNPDLQAILFAPDRDVLLDWLVSLPLLHIERGAGWCMLHAGLMPKWNIAIAEKRAREVESHLQGPDRDKLLRNMYGDKPAWSPKLKGIERDRAIINVFTRMRYCTAHGRIAFDAKGAPGTQTPGLYPWFAVPGQARRELNIVCGHWSTLGLMIGGGVHAIDTGCVWGGPLTALELVPPGQPPRIVQVAGRTP